MLGIFGLEGVGKTKLLQAVANYYKEINPETILYITKDDLQRELEKAIKKKDVFLISLKRRVKSAEVVCIDEVSNFIIDGKLKDYFLTWFYYCKSHRKRLIYTQDCSEKMYCVMQMLGTLEPHATLVGIPKEGQNRNLDVVREIE